MQEYHIGTRDSATAFLKIILRSKLFVAKQNKIMVRLSNIVL
jgi:hypothetical protein